MRRLTTTWLAVALLALPLAACSPERSSPAAEGEGEGEGPAEGEGEGAAEGEGEGAAEGEGEGAAEGEGEGPAEGEGEGPAEGEGEGPAEGEGEGPAEGEGEGPEDCELVDQTGGISACGGQPHAPGGDYCDAEVLEWSYDPATGTLTVVDKRAHLNCGGKRDIVIVLEGDVWVIRETDSPGEEGRMRCMCMFDFDLEARCLPGGTMRVRLERIITDSDPAAEVLFDGEIDLGEGAGRIVLDDDPSPGCEEEMDSGPAGS